MLDIGRALVLNPRLLLLDEPTEGLAPIIVDELLAALRELSRAGLSMIVVEQKPKKILPFTDRAIVLDPKNTVSLFNRGLVHLEKQSYDSAIADFNAALKLDPRMAKSLYGRGTARVLKGDGVGGNDDIAAAKAAKPNVADEMARYGVK